MDSNDPLYFAVNPPNNYHIALSTLDPRKPTTQAHTVFVRNPPRQRLPTSSVQPWGLGIDSRLESSRDDPDLEFYNDLYHDSHKLRRRATSGEQKMVKRRSMQSILVPAFLQGSSSIPTSPVSDTSPPSSKRVSRERAHTSAATFGRWSVLNNHQQQQPVPSPLPPTEPTAAVSSPRDSPPPDFLLDDDPFANLSAAPSLTRSSHTALPVPPEPELPALPTPRSPLTPTVEEIPSIALVRANSSTELDARKSPLSRAFASTRMPIAAHQRPAFSSRPSLPSLSTLAQMNVVLTKKVRKGRVGAGLPFEPWDNPNCELPPRVLQDIQASSTQCLPPGTQPLLPSQIIGIASGTLAANTTEEVDSPSHTNLDPSSVTYSDELSSTPNAISQHIPLEVSDSLPRPSSELCHEQTNLSSASSDHVDVCYSGPSSNDLEHGDEGAFDEGDHDGSLFSFPVYGHHRDHQYASFTDFDTDTTTTTSTSCDEFSPPPSSRVSSLDLLELPLSRSVSSRSATSSLRSVSSSKGSIGHTEDDDIQGLTSLQDSLALENDPAKDHGSTANNTTVTLGDYSSSSTHTTRSSLDDSDSLRSPLDSEYHFPPIASPESYSKPKIFHFPGQPTSSSSSSLLWSPPASSTASSSYLPQFSSIYAEESSPSDLVENWRDQFGVDSGSGSFLSDLDLTDEHHSSELHTPISTFGFDVDSRRIISGGQNRSSMDEDDLDLPYTHAPTANSLSLSHSSFIHANLTGNRNSDLALNGMIAQPDGFISESSTAMPPPSLPTHIPSPKLDFDVQSNSGFLVAGAASAEAPWPSSADTVRPGALLFPAGLGRHSGAGSEGDGAGLDSLSPASMAGEAINGNHSTNIRRMGGGAVMDECVPGLHDLNELESTEYRPFSSSSSSSSPPPPPLPSSSSSSLSSYRDQDYEYTHDRDCYERDDGQEIAGFSSYDLDMLRYQAPRSSAVSGGQGAYYRSEERAGSKLVDGSGWEASSSGGGGGGGGYRARSQSHSNRGSGGGYNEWGVNGGRRYNTTGLGRRGGDDEDDDDGRDDRRRRRQLHLGPEDSTAVRKGTSSSASENGDESADDYASPLGSAGVVGAAGAPSPTSPSGRFHTSQPGQAARFPLSSTTTSSSDDDIPLARRIPTALTAQKSIRRQVREERQHKRLERAATTAAATSKSSSSAPRAEYERDPFSRDRNATLRPAGAGGPVIPPAMAISSSQEAAVHAGSATGAQRTKRSRTLTMPSKPSTHNPFSPEELAKRLQNVQLAAEHQHQPQPPSYPPARGARGSFDAPDYSTAGPSAVSGLARGRSVKDNTENSGSSSPLTTKPGLRLMRSFRRERRGGDEQPQQAVVPALPSDAEHKIALKHQQLSRSQSRVREEAAVPSSGSPQGRKRSLSLSRGAAAVPAAPYVYDDPSAPPVPPLPMRMSGTDEAAGSPQHHFPRKLWKAPSMSGGRTSGDVEKEQQQRILGKSPVTQPAVLGAIVQQRVFVGDMQRFNMVEITAGTTAGEVVDMIEAQGTLNGIVGVGGWMVWEVAQDFGMERPIRSFELLSDVQASWNKDKMVNLFVLKMTPLAVPLNRSAIPEKSPVHSGYIEWEAKRGKWSKRWMILREHSLWLAKREGKEEVLLCSLSNFDAYHINRSHRAPKPFAFAVKSTDSLTFFEDASDYLHNFACNEKDGLVWMEKILVARSYVLHQERQILFNPKAAGGNAAAALSRSGTRKSSSQRQHPAPLVNVAPPFSSQVTHQHVFEPGSLLHKQL